MKDTFMHQCVSGSVCVYGIMDLRPFAINGKKVKVQNKSG